SDSCSYRPRAVFITATISCLSATRTYSAESAITNWVSSYWDTAQTAIGVIRLPWWLVTTAPWAFPPARRWTFMEILVRHSILGPTDLKGSALTHTSASLRHFSKQAEVRL